IVGRLRIRPVLRAASTTPAPGTGVGSTGHCVPRIGARVNARAGLIRRCLTWPSAAHHGRTAAGRVHPGHFAGLLRIGAPPCQPVTIFSRLLEQLKSLLDVYHEAVV